MVAGYWPEPIHAYRGIPQSYYIDEFIDLERDPHSGYVLMPISGFPVLAAVNTPGFGREHFRQMRDFSKLGGLLVLLHDRSEGSVRSGDSLGKPEIRYALDAEDRALLAEGMRHCAEVLFAAGAERVVAPFLLEPLVLARGADLRRDRAPGGARGNPPDRFHAPAVHLPDGRRSRQLGRERLRGAARRARGLRRRHERVPDLARRAAADHDGGARRPHGPSHHRARIRARRVTAPPAEGPSRPGARRVAALGVGARLALDDAVRAAVAGGRRRLHVRGVARHAGDRRRRRRRPDPVPELRPAGGRHHRHGRADRARDGQRTPDRGRARDAHRAGAGRWSSGRC